MVLLVVYLLFQYSWTPLTLRPSSQLLNPFALQPRPQVVSTDPQEALQIIEPLRLFGN